MKKSVFVIEEDHKFEKEIKEALEQINLKISIQEYQDLAAFVDWLKEVVDRNRRLNKTPDPNAPLDKSGGEETEIDLVVCKSEFLKQKGFNLLKRTQDYFLLNGLCSRESPTGFVLTAFDTEKFDFSR